MKYEELASKLAGKEVPQEVLDLVGIKEERAGRFIPNRGDEYWFIHNDGKVTDDVWDGDVYTIDRNRFKMGNIYETQEETELERDRRLALVECLDEIARLNDGWLPDWTDGTECKHSLMFSHDYKTIDIDRLRWSQRLKSTHYFKSSELAQQFIKTHGDKYKLVMGWQ